MKRMMALLLVLILSIASCSTPEEKKEDSLGENIYENKILNLRKKLDLLADGKTSYDDVKEIYKSTYKETVFDKAISETVVVEFVISKDILQRLSQEKVDIDFLNSDIRLIDYKEKSKEEIDRIQTSMIEFSEKYNAKIYKHYNTDIVFSEPIEDTSGYGTHKVFFKEKLTENILLCGWYLFDKDDKIISYKVSSCENNQKSIDYYLKATVKFKE